MTSALFAPDAATIARWRGRIREETFANHALCMGIAIHGGGAPADAVPFLRRALTHGALRAESWFALVQALRDAGQTDAADAAEAEARREDAGFALAAQPGLARRWMETPVIPPDRVAAFLERGLALAADAGDALILARLHLLHLLFLCRAGRLDGVARIWAGRPALDVAADPAARAGLAVLLAELGRELLRAGLAGPAREALDLAVRRLDAGALGAGDLIAAETLLIDSLNGDWDAAAAAGLLTAARAACVPRLATFLAALGGVAIRHGDGGLAEDACAAALALDPANARIRQIHPVLQIFAGRLAEGLAGLDRAHGEGVLADLGLRLPAQILLERGDHRAALSVLDIAFKGTRPVHGELLALESQVRLAMGDAGAVRARMDDAATPAPIARKIAGLLALHEGRWDDADALFAGLRAGDATSPYPDLWRAVARLGARDWPGLLAALDDADRIRPVREVAGPLRAFADAQGAAPLRGTAARSFVILACPALAAEI